MLPMKQTSSVLETRISLESTGREVDNRTDISASSSTSSVSLQNRNENNKLYLASAKYPHKC